MVKWVSPQVVSQILHPVPEKAFQFASNIGDYTGEVAQSLADFLNTISSTSRECLEFHLYPRPPDFERWISETLGDTYLANQIRKIAGVHTGDTLRQTLQTIVENRLKELRVIALTQLKNLGTKTAIQLVDAGIHSISELAHARPTELATQIGVTEKRASRWIQNAQLLINS